MGTHENRGWEVYSRREGQELGKIFRKIAYTFAMKIKHRGKCH